MNKTWGIVIFVVAALVVIALASRNGSDDSMMISDQMNSDTKISESVSVDEKEMDEDKTGDDPINDKTVDGAMYQVYSPTNLATAHQAGKRVVLFFHASWCPTCKQADADITASLTDLPEDVVVLKTDYDTYTELKEQYGITYQHTFVVVDSEGNQLQKWNGGGVSEINSRLN